MSLTHGSESCSVLGRNPDSGRFLVGHRSEYHTRLARLTAITEALQAEYKPTSAAHSVLLSLAAVHIDAAARARSTIKRTRESNAALKVLARVPKREAPKQTLDEYIRQRGKR